MNHLQIVQNLKANKTVFQKLLSNLTKEQITWKPNAQSWCPLEIICHLVDEEREDFRNRLQFALRASEEMPHGIDPVGWVIERKYIEQDFEAKLAEFLQERDESVQFLESLKNPKWDNGFVHPKLGLLTADFYLNNWLAHDYLHIRQITRVKYQFLKAKSKVNIDYAGKW